MLEDWPDPECESNGPLGAEHVVDCQYGGCMLMNATSKYDYDECEQPLPFKKIHITFIVLHAISVSCVVK